MSNPERRTGLLVFLHGHGSEPIALPDRYRGGMCPGWTCVAPAGPRPADPGRSWFDATARGVDAVQLHASVDLIVALVDELTDALALPDERVVLGGFSQGGATAIAAAATGRRFGALLLESAFVPEALDLDIDLSRVNIEHALVQHGTTDDVVPIEVAHWAADALASTGCEVETAWHDAGHERHPGIEATTRAWIERLSAAWSGPTA